MTLYTTHCPLCNIIESKLNSKNIDYTLVDDEEELNKLNFESFPVLLTNSGEYITGLKLNNYVNSL